MNGFDDLAKHLDDLAQRAQDLDGQHSVPVAELMPPEFVSKCSSFGTIDALFEASPFKIESAEDFAAIPDDDWDAFIAQSTSFKSWEEMQEAAATEWTTKQLGF